MSKEEIKIGDEVLHNTERYIVVAISNGSYYCLRADGKFVGEYLKSVLEKTGRHFNQIVNVLNQMDNHYTLKRSEQNEASPTGAEKEVQDGDSD